MRDGRGQGEELAAIPDDLNALEQPPCLLLGKDRRLAALDDVHSTSSSRRRRSEESSRRATRAFAYIKTYLCRGS